MIVTYHCAMHAMRGHSHAPHAACSEHWLWREQQMIRSNQINHGELMSHRYESCTAASSASSTAPWCTAVHASVTSHHIHPHDPTWRRMHRLEVRNQILHLT